MLGIILHHLHRKYQKIEIPQILRDFDTKIDISETQIESLAKLAKYAPETFEQILKTSNPKAVFDEIYW